MSTKKNMTTHSHDSKNPKNLPDVPATSLGIPLPVPASKHQPLTTASTIAKANRRQQSSSAYISRRSKDKQTPPTSHHRDHKPDNRSHPIAPRPDQPNVNVPYDEIIRNLQNITKYVRSKQSRPDPALTDDTTSRFPETVVSSTNTPAPAKHHRKSIPTHQDNLPTFKPPTHDK